jgi:hypothetical protein
VQRELRWDFAALETCAARCPMCQFLLYCLVPCQRAKNGDNCDVFIRLEPIAGYVGFGELTFWMTITGKQPQAKRETLIKCQLAVGLRMQQDTRGPNQVITHSNSSVFETIPNPSDSLEDDGMEQTSFALPDPAGHPSRSAGEIGLVSAKQTEYVGAPKPSNLGYGSQYYLRALSVISTARGSKLERKSRSCCRQSKNYSKHVDTF